MHTPNNNANYTYNGPTRHPAELQAQQALDNETRERATRYHNQRILNAITTGKTLFTRTTTGWAIIGPTNHITPGALITVTRHNGDTTQVRATTTRETHNHNGIHYTIANYQPLADGTPTPHPPPDEPEQPPARRTLAYNLAHTLGYTLGRQLGRTPKTR